MLQLRKILLRGSGVVDASVAFVAGGNIVAGESDTGKSYLMHCLDYIFGADELRKRIPEAEPYEQLFVEFENSEKTFLTLERSLSGGDLAAHRCRIDEISKEGEKIAYRRHGKSNAVDVTSILFPFAGISEAKLRSNNDGKTQRLTIRTLMPVITVDEISVIEEQSPVLGRSGYDNTARERMFAFMLSGKDDQGVIAAEKREIARAKLNAQLTVIDDLLEPLEKRFASLRQADPDDSIERVDSTIASISAALARFEDEREALFRERQAATAELQHADAQILAIDELLTRYHLLDERYGSDLERLDFIAEGAHYFDGLQEVKCPLCDQLMTPDHAHSAASGSVEVYASARAEAAKILAQRKDLEDAIASLELRREARARQRNSALEVLDRTGRRLDSVVQPSLQTNTARLQSLVSRRVELETTKIDRELLESLRVKKNEIERAASATRGTKRQWEPLPSKALRTFCEEVEAVLREWRWVGAGRVEFDERTFDIIVDGQARQSHGKGVRAVLYSAFVIALLRYCQREGRPHPGLVVIDSPLTSYKKRGTQVKGADGPIDASVEAAFWSALKSVDKTIQIIVIENKEPPNDVASAVHYEWFAGDTAQEGDRVAFIPAAMS
ncbi:hypothetical protein KXR53_02045 [Inquilinus limosus]|uniref:hypothetical protein n=1 Tax=Inquilinus limosus TaxID=171674 RepID=UPI003F1633AB